MVLQLQVASLLSMTNNSADVEYLKHLEESLTSARAQLDKFTKRCQELENSHVTNSVSKVSYSLVYSIVQCLLDNNT